MGGFNIAPPRGYKLDQAGGSPSGAAAPSPKLPPGYALDSAPAGGPPAPQPERGWLDSVGDYARGVWNTANPVAAVKGLAEAAAHPIDTVRGIGQAHGQVALKAEQAFKNGDYVTGVRHVIDYLIPVLGPQIDAAADKVNEGKIAEGMGEATGIGLGIAAPELAKRMPSIPLVPKITQTLNPAERQAVAFADSQGIPLDAATRTGNTFVKAAQAIAQNQPLGSLPAARMRGQQAKALARVGGELADQVHPAAATPESAGQAVRTAMESRIAGLKGAADEAYDAFRQAASDPAHSKTVQVGTRQVDTGVMDEAGRPVVRSEAVTKDIPLPVDMRPIKEALAPIHKRMSMWMEPAKRDASKAYQAIRSILEGEDYLPATIAEDGLSGLKSMAFEENPNLRNVNQGVGALAVKHLQRAIDQAVGDAGPEALQSLQRGRAAHATKMESAEALKQLREEPVKAFNQLTWRDDTGIEYLRKLQAMAPAEMPKVGRAFLQQLFDTATEEGGFNRARSILTKWQNLGPETKKVLFRNQAMVESVDNFLTLANKIAENPNPSGSAVVGSLIPGGLLTIQNPFSGATWLLGGAAMARLLFSPKGAQMLTKGLTVPVSNKLAAAATAGNILHLAGGDARKVQLPLAAQTDGQESFAPGQPETPSVALPRSPRVAQAQAPPRPGLPTLRNPGPAPAWVGEVKYRAGVPYYQDRATGEWIPLIHAIGQPR